MHIAVLGAGIQGTCVALELAGRGHRVDLFERTDACVTQTSAQSEGKVHLGLVYGNDPSLRTARMMIDGALAFAPLMRRWLGDAFDRIPQSSPFRYVIHADSLLTVDAMRRHFSKCRDIACDVSARPGNDYFKRDVRQPVRQLPEADWEATFDGLQAIVPGIADLASEQERTVMVREGIVFAWGTGDIDDRHSGLHERYAIGVHSYGRYHSINTGKSTMAPLFASQAAARVLGII